MPPLRPGLFLRLRATRLARAVHINARSRWTRRMRKRTGGWHVQHPIAADVLHYVLRPVRPDDLNVLRHRVRSQPEVNTGIAARQIAVHARRVAMLLPAS